MLLERSMDNLAALEESMSELAATRAAAIKTRDKFVEEALSTRGSAVGAFRKAGKDQIAWGSQIRSYVLLNFFAGDDRVIWF